jgi:hypothetical protein
MIQVMALWGEDFSTWSLEEALLHQSANRAWSKELRRKTSSLVNSRLANEITQVAYLENRKLGQEEAVECKRRATILDSHIAHHVVRSR